MITGKTACIICTKIGTMVLTNWIKTGRTLCTICNTKGRIADISCTITGRTSAISDASTVITALNNSPKTGRTAVTSCPISGSICINKLAIIGRIGSNPVCNVFMIVGRILLRVSSTPDPLVKNASFIAVPTWVMIPQSLSNTANPSSPKVFCINPRTCSKWVDT